MKLYLFLTISVFIFSSCKNHPNTQHSSSESVPIAKQSQTEETLPSYQKRINKSEFGKEWVFTVDQGILECKSNEVVFISAGKIYAINGAAKQSKRYFPVEEIWADDPSIKGAKKNIGVIINEGLKLCN